MVEQSFWPYKMMKNGRFWTTVALFLLIVPLTRAQGKAFASLKPDRVETGDTITLSLIVSGINTEPKEVDFVSWSDVFPRANILARSDWRRSGTQWVRHFTLISFDSATLTLPPLTVLMAVGEPLKTNAMTLTVFPTRGSDLSDIEPIRDIYREPITWMDYWPWAAGGMVLIALAYWFFRRNSRRPQPVIIPVPIPTPIVSAREIALQKLKELQSQQLWKKGEVKEHYAALSLIIREFLEGNYGVAALESTSAEILTLLANTPFSANQVPILRDILHKTDMVKYAQSQPAEAIHETVLEKTRALLTPDYGTKVETKTSIPNKYSGQKNKPGKYEPL